MNSSVKSVDCTLSVGCYYHSKDKLSVKKKPLFQQPESVYHKNSNFEIKITIPQTYVLNILIYIQQDATLHSLFYLENALHVSGGTIAHHQERKQLYRQHLVFDTPLLLSAAIVEELELVSVC